MVHERKSLLRLLALIAAAMLVFGACGGDEGGGDAGGGATEEEQTDTGGDAGGDTGGATVSVTAADFSFDPSEITVTAGEEVTVELTNEGEAPHTFTAEAIGADTGNVDAGASGTATFTAPEEETEFICTIHPNMKGTIVPE